MAAAGEFKRFRGLFTALVTPFRDGAVDWATLDALVERQVAAGVDGVVPCGSTGESATLSHDEHDRVIKAVVKRVKGRCPVVAGTGSNATAEAIRMSKHAAEVGADGVMIVAPYYNRPTQEGMFLHFSAVAEAVDLPVILYNVPARCAVDLLDDTVLRVHERCPNVVALKDASGGLERVIDLTKRGDVDVFCGDDFLTLAFMTHGAVGVISVISNLVPERMVSLVKVAAKGEMANARKHYDPACGLAGAIGRVGPNPIPVKTAMAMAGLCTGEFRLPLCAMDEHSMKGLRDTLVAYEVL